MHRHRITAMIVLPLATGLACSQSTGLSEPHGSEPNPDHPTPAPGDAEQLDDGQELSALREKMGAHSSFARPVRVVIHDAAGLAALPIDIGPVDFEHEMVLVAAMGPTPSDHFSIRIVRVWREGELLRAEVENRFPAAAAPRRTTWASPYHVVVLPRSPLNIVGFSATFPARAFRESGEPPGGRQLLQPPPRPTGSD